MRLNSPGFMVAILTSIVLVLSMFPTTALSQSPIYRKIAEIVDAETRYALFTGSVLVAKNGVIIYASASGDANKEYGIPNVLETRYNVSSTQKSMVATLAMQLYQDGSIDIEDPLTEYYPDCPWNVAGQIRIKYLLNHTSGLSDYRESEEYQRNVDSYTCIDDVLPLVWKYEPAYTPGERFTYSNSGQLLLKGIIEKVTGKRVNQVLKDNIWHPLGMDNTAPYVGGDLMKFRATAYTLAADGETYVRVLGEPAAYTGGGTYTTVLDLLKFDQALYGEELLNEATKKIMFTPVEASPNYAYGWMVSESGGTTVIEHPGGSGGFSTEFKRYPDIGYTLIIQSNDADAAYYLSTRIEPLIVGLPYSVATEQDLCSKRGLTYQGHGLWTKAIEEFEKNIAGDNPHMPSLYQAARTRILGEFDQETAVILLDRYISLADEATRPSIAAAWWRKGVAFEQLRKIDEAITCHEKCLELDKGWAEAKEALDRLRQSK